MPTCCVPYCVNSSVNNVKVSFHEFPHETPLFVEAWLKKIGRPNWRPGVRSVVCSDHFDKHDFDRQGKLRCGSIPFKFPDQPLRKRRKKDVIEAAPLEHSKDAPPEIKPNHTVWQLCSANQENGPKSPLKTPIVNSFSLQACRICGEISGSNVPIFSEEGAKIKLCDLIQHLPIKVTPDDVLPLQVCVGCISSLESFHHLTITSQITNDALIGKLPAQTEENTAQGVEKERTQNSSPDDINLNCTCRVLVLELPNGDQKPLSETLTHAVHDLSSRIAPKGPLRGQRFGKMMIVNLNSGRTSYIEQMCTALDAFFSNGKVHKQDLRGTKCKKLGFNGQYRFHTDAPKQCHDTDLAENRLKSAPFSMKLGTADQSDPLPVVTHPIKKTYPPKSQTNGPTEKPLSSIQPVVKLTRITLPFTQSGAESSVEIIPSGQKGTQPISKSIASSEAAVEQCERSILSSQQAAQATSETNLPFLLLSKPVDGSHHQQSSTTPNVLQCTQQEGKSVIPGHQAQELSKNLLVTERSSDGCKPGGKSTPISIKYGACSQGEPLEGIKNIESLTPHLNLSQLREGLIEKLRNGKQFKAGDKIIGVVVRGNQDAGEVQKKIFSVFRKEKNTFIAGNKEPSVILPTTGDTLTIPPTPGEPSTSSQTTEPAPSVVEERAVRVARQENSNLEVCDNSVIMKPKLSVTWSKYRILADSLQKMFIWSTCFGSQPGAVELVCRVCSTAVQNQKHSEAHLLEHRDLQCPVCLQFFLTTECTQEHMKSFHEEVINEEDRKQHHNISRRVPLRKSIIKTLWFQCSQCEKRFRQKYALERHLVGHKIKEAESIKPTCQVCGKKVDSNEALQDHMIVHSKKEASLCDVCGEVFKHWGSFQQHVGRVHGERYSEFAYQCTHCRKLFKNLHKLQAHLEKHEQLKNQTYVCTTCGKVFFTLNNLRKHEELHGEPKRECRFCNQRFHRNDHLRQHVFRHHVRTNRPQRQYRCRLCAGTSVVDQDVRIFSTMRALLQHYKVDHGCPRGSLGPVKRASGCFRCEQCQRSFSNSTLLHHHNLWHAGKRPYKCSTCGAGFMTSDRLHNHVRLHTNERPFSCDVCGKSFRCRPVLTQHKQTHVSEDAKHPCSFCGRRFSRTDNLALHMLTHTGEKPWKCLLCGARFRSKGDCNKHICGVHKRPFADIPLCQSKVQSDVIAHTPPPATVPDEEEEDETDDVVYGDEDDNDEDLETEEPAIEYDDFNL